jgi:hypothetical protein
MCPSVIRASNCSKTFLTSGIPDLQLDGGTIDVDGLNFEIDTDGGNEGFGESIISESKEQRTLSYARVSN